MISFDAVDIIRTKRDGGELSDPQIDWVISAYSAGEVADDAMSALLMAVCWRGLSTRELARWTAAMINSGERLDLSGLSRPTADKHSTGGVGDKVSLVLAPLVAACGVAVPQLSGRGLGHTGGTLDKLESIPGWRANLSLAEIYVQLEEVGAVICAAGADLAPADRKLYALRDVTGTVESIPLISASIMSKKIAEGTDALVLDVKVGSGAFMPDLASARELAETMVGLGREHGVAVTALLTAMDVPLGRAVGNALEVTESVETLSGRGPADLREITLALATEMVSAAGVDADPAAALDDGSALAMWERMIAAQGGDPHAALPAATHVETVVADRDGVVSRLDAWGVGIAAWRLGAGRARKEDAVDPAAGIICRARPGEQVRAGDVVLELHTDDSSRFPRAFDSLEGAVVVSDTAPVARPLVLDRVG
ncbi:MAG TPA: thymidine phosphorylase [Mycobacteriales bacterium]|nr:thymidine phosphorylase [Mycobacteriales bacterium]